MLIFYKITFWIICDKNYYFFNNKKTQKFVIKLIVYKLFSVVIWYIY